MREKETLLNKINVLEIPSDVLLYWALRGIGFNQVITKTELDCYREILSKVHKESGASNTLAFYDPFSCGYSLNLFKQVTLENNMTGIILKPVSNQKEAELQQLRLTKLECFSRKQGEKIERLFFLAHEQFYQQMKKQNSKQYEIPKESVPKQVKQKLLKLSKFVTVKFHH